MDDFVIIHLVACAWCIQSGARYLGNGLMAHQFLHAARFRMLKEQRYDRTGSAGPTDRLYRV